MSESKSSGRRKRTPDPPPPTFDEKLINGLIPWRTELFGLGLFLIGIFTVIALPDWVDMGALSTWASFMREGFGWGAYPLFLSLAATGVHLMLNKVKRPYHIEPSQIIGIEMMLLAALPLTYQITNATRLDTYEGRGGGLFGWALSQPLIDFLGPLLTGLLFIGFFAWGLTLVLRITMDDVQIGLLALSERLQQWAIDIAPKPQITTAAQQTEIEEVLPPEQLPDEIVPAIDIDLAPEHDAHSSTYRSKKLPPIDLLEESGIIGISDEEIDAKKQIIEETLADFGLPAQVTQIKRGPAVTQFGVMPGYIERPGPDGEMKQHKVRVNQIAALQRDLALALAVQRLRVQAPVPGQGVVGIEVPNDEVALVRLKSIIQSQAYRKLKSPLAVGLGRDVSGAPIPVDLAKLPHLLIAGTTGSGKSICINSLITCLVFNNTPDKLNLVMIDPKKVEFIRFNGMPHLIGNVEVDADRAVGVLRWLTAEMDRRYEMFTQVNARNLNGYNRKVAKHKTLKKMPYIAVFIDELADLMHIYPGDVERTLCRLAQMARATGIHLVVATQRPSTDVITGLIKANFPARLSFSVASGIDSRVILDSVGAEQLLGKGDSLFLSPDASGAMRNQGVFISDTEVERITKFWHEHPDEYETIPCPWDSLIAKHALLDETDSLLETAIDLAQKQDFLSTSFLQRRLRVGYPRAARIMEHLFEMGLVEDPKTGGKTRKTYVDEAEEDPLKRIIDERHEPGES
ncbi:MAG: DNA translocase FtsK [Chloroflexi bacterium]|nr:MAG: DNA translocase FtsK [Chloroflexota bacterium]